MSKTRPALDPHKLRYMTWGNQDLDSTTAFDGTNATRSWTSSRHPLTETDSGAVILINVVMTGENKTCTLPSAKKGLYFKFVWTLEDTDYSRIIKTASTSELIKGTVIQFDNGDDDASNSMVTNQLNGSSHDEIQLVTDIHPGSYLELVSDGSHWYTVDSKIITEVADGDAAVVES